GAGIRPTLVTGVQTCALPISIAVNGAAWDGDFGRAAVPGLLSVAGIGSIRYPGGSYAGTFNWQTTTDTIKPAQYMGIVAAANARSEERRVGKEGDPSQRTTLK